MVDLSHDVAAGAGDVVQSLVGGSSCDVDGAVEVDDEAARDGRADDQQKYLEALAGIV